MKWDYYKIICGQPRHWAPLYLICWVSIELPFPLKIFMFGYEPYCEYGKWKFHESVWDKKYVLDKEVRQWMKVLAARHSELSWISGTQMVEEKDKLLQIIVWALHKPYGVHARTHTHRITSSCTHTLKDTHKYCYIILF